MNALLNKEFLGALSVLLSLTTYSLYFVSVLRHKTVPHIFSWIIWTIMNGVAFVAQVMGNAGPGSWALGYSTIFSVAVTILIFTRGEKNITRSDQASFVGAILAILLWYLTNDPFWSVILVSFIDVTACYPTLRKSFQKPWNEPAFLYGIGALRGILAFAALNNYSIITALFPLAMVLSNGLIALVLVLRRSMLHRSNQSDVSP